MSDWTDDDPGAGDLSTLDNRAQKLALQAQHAGEMQALVQQQEAVVAGAWTGTGHDGWANKAAQTTVAWATLQTWAWNEQAALGRYVEAVTSIKTRADRQKGLLADAKADATRAEQATSVSQAVSSPQGSGLPSPSPGPSPSIAPEQLALEQAQSSYLSAMKALAAERQAADDALVASIRDAYVEVTAAGTPVLPAGLTEESLAGMTPTTLLTTLSSLSATDLADLMAAEPAIAQDFWNNPPEASTASSWWAALSDDQRAALLAGAPSVIGNLGGVPYADRIVANQNQLDQAAARSDLTKAQQGTVDQANKTLGSGGHSGRAPRGLVDLNLENKPPLAAVSIGDLDTADKVTWSVPGMNTAAQDSLWGWTGATSNLQQQQEQVDPGSHAAVSWLGYDTPGLPESLNDPFSEQSVLMNTLAVRGSRRLAVELDAFHDARSVNGNSPASINVVAHSYGTTTTAYALTKTRYAVDTVTFVASAGIDATVIPDASALNVRSVGEQPQVFATQARADVVATIGRDVDPHDLGTILNALGNSGQSGIPPVPQLIEVPQNHRINPDDDFGAIRYDSDGYDVGTTHLRATGGHDAIGSGETFSAPKGGGYLDKGTQSLLNTAIATTGNHQFLETPLAEPTPSPQAPPTPPAK
ncbi:alpha/beta hydrolase [Frondihabitans sp. 4ASC-45]|uniref:alpha/beta hydrolase n=1 Tax=Frondihabitans sp. 4ASC-45 TaxID=3111636 RepID=UPI003C1C4305